MIRSVVFDFGNVLYWFDYSRFYNAVQKHSALPADQIRDVLYDGEDALSRRLETGTIGRDEFISLLRSRARIDLPPDQLERHFVDIFEPNTAVVELAVELAALVPIALLSNTNEIHYEQYMKHTEAIKLMSAVSLSHRVGAMKPARAIFREVLDQLQLPAEQCVFIDDIPAYVEAARALGFSGVHYDGAVDLRRALVDLGLPLRA